MGCVEYGALHGWTGRVAGQDATKEIGVVGRGPRGGHQGGVDVAQGCLLARVVESAAAAKWAAVDDVRAAGFSGSAFEMVDVVVGVVCPECDGDVPRRCDRRGSWRRIRRADRGRTEAS